MRRSDQFDEEYFQNGFGPDSYERKEPWLTFYRNIVDEIIRSLKPRNVLDAGCALGMIVEAFWDRGIDAKGIDISDYAISHVRADMREHCKVASLAESFGETFDLIVSIEVLEHMQADEAERAIENFAAAADTVLFSSSPYDFEEITHVNVRPPLSWMKLFAKHGFAPDILYDASFITPHAILFRKGEVLSEEVLTLMSEHLRSRHELTAASQSKARLAELEAQFTDTETQLKEVYIRAGQLEYQLKESALKHARQQEELNRELSRIRSESKVVLESKLQEADIFRERLASIESSSVWRATSSLRAIGAKTPQPIRRRIRQLAKLGYWVITPHKIPGRIAFIRNRNANVRHEDPVVLISHEPQVALQSDIERNTAAPSVVTAREIIDRHFHYLAPLPIFKDRSSEKTLTILTDSVDRNSLFGGVGTALVAGVMLANRMQARLRLVTRSEPPDPAVLGTIMEAHKITFGGTTNFVHMPIGETRPLPIGEHDLMLTTSWWGTYAALGSISAEKIIYLLQEDERMFYPHDDTRLRCAEVLSNPKLALLINTDLLLSHFSEGPDPIKGIRERAVSFEPAFPTFPRPQKLDKTGQKKNLFFYARPFHVRNLYWRGLEVINSAMREGVFPADEWDVHFVGHELPPMELPGGIQPIVSSQLTWSEYAALISKMDVGLSLMDTPHPSYPPLDLAASGAIVVTNAHGMKTSLDRWSKNIIAAKSDVPSLVKALKLAAKLSDDMRARKRNCDKDQIARDWNETLAPAIDQALTMRSRNFVHLP